jgi:5-methyltetrahydropteroyltriglutamate--homocysteine methyltransferase
MGALLTTAVGSYPKPERLQQARYKVARGEMSPEELERLEREATAFWIRAQEEIGLDILVDGEQYRGDMVTYFAENLEGFTVSGLVRSYGNRYYRKPIAVGPVGRRAPLTLRWWQFAQGLTGKPVKGMLTGPYTMADWSFNEYYPTFTDFVMAMAHVVREEAMDLVKAGARYIQIDEPAVSARPEEMELASRALGVVTKGLDCVVITHMCYGDFAAVFPHLLALPVHVLDVEMANSNYDLLEIFRRHPTDKTVAMGVIDVHSHRIETVEQVKAAIRRGLEVFPPERLWIDPDCGLKTRTVEEALAKLRVMVTAVREVKEEMGLP